MNKLSCLVTILVLFASCAATKYTLTEAMTGTWQAEKYRVKMIGAHGTQKDSVTIISMEEFKTELDFTATYAKYKANGVYQERYVGGRRDDSLILEVNGKWSIAGDTLIITEEKPVARTMMFDLKTKRNKAILKGLIDWDNDGLEDDELTIVCTKLEEDKWPYKE